MPFGLTELIIVLVIVLAIFGPRNLPKLASMFGNMFREIKDIKKDLPTKDDLGVDVDRSEDKTTPANRRHG